MEVFVAVVRLRSNDDDSSVRRFHTPQDFDLLFDSKSRKHGLPRFKLLSSEQPLDCAIRNVRRMSKYLGQRAVPVSLCPDRPTSSKEVHSKLICLPVVGLNAAKLEKIEGHSFFNMSHVLNMSLKSEEWLEKESQYLITCLDEWLSKHQHADIEFMSSLFRNRPAIERIRNCAHNPGQNPRISRFCYKVANNSSNNSATPSEMKRKTSELEETVLNSNNTHAYMLAMEKYKLYLINPVFGGIVTRRMKEAAPEYFAKGRRTRFRQKPAVQDSWEQAYRLHAACYEGNVQTVKKLLNQGYNTNEPDSDGWCPLHYCTFYNRFEACELILLHNGTKANMTNKTGATALHFAALVGFLERVQNGHEHLVELILSHTGIDTTIRDINGKTALDLCEQVPKPEWIRTAYLLRNTQLRPHKIEVQLVGRSSLQIRCDIGSATAGLLREKVLELEGINSPNANRVFAIWIISERLGLQLKAEKHVQIHLDRWSEHLDKWGDPPLTNHQPDADIPRIVLKRDARTLLGDEQELTRNHPTTAIRLLYAEAESNYLQGLLPCKDKDSIKMSAIILQLLCGAKQSAVDYNLMTKIMPKHLIPHTNDRSYQRLVNKVLEAHSTLAQSNVIQLQFDFLQFCWKQKVYGCTFFKALMHRQHPPRSSVEVFVGLNDFGISIINRQTLKQIESVEIGAIELEYESGKNYFQIHRKKHDTLVFNTHQASLVSNLFTQIKNKLSSAHVKK